MESLHLERRLGVIQLGEELDLDTVVVVVVVVAAWCYVGIKDNTRGAYLQDRIPFFRGENPFLTAG